MRNSKMPMDRKPLLQINNLSVSFLMYEADAPFFQAKQEPSVAIQQLSLRAYAGEVLTIVGASGSGKSLLADAIMGLYEANSKVEGTIIFDGVPQTSESLKHLRRDQIALIPQSVDALDPLRPVGKQIMGAYHRRDRAERKSRMQELLDRYQLGPDVAKLYPFELSGGMARRVLLCCALMEHPRLLIADEPTPGLDLELALQALQDLRDFANQGGAVILITHDIELALKFSDRVAIFHEGTVLEEVPVEAFDSPDQLSHPFSRALWHALPEHGFKVAG